MRAMLISMLFDQLSATPAAKANRFIGYL